MCVIFDARRTTSSYPSSATPENFWQYAFLWVFMRALLNTGMNSRFPNCYKPSMVSFVTSSEKLIHTVNQQRLYEIAHRLLAA